MRNKKRCNRCNKIKLRTQFHKNGKYIKAYCKSCRSKRGRIKNRNKKIEVINAYGNKCKCCNEKRIEFLTIDHMKGNGKKHRKEIKAGGTGLYSFLIKNKFPKNLGLRVLCMNCNWSIGHYGYCPHKKIKEFIKVKGTQ